MQQDCHLNSNAVAPEDVLVQNNSSLTVVPEVTLDIDFVNYNMTINSGSTVWIKSGGSIK